MDEFQYFFGEQGFNLKEQRGLKEFFKYAKTHIRMNALLEKAFATAGKADSWNMIADAFGMKDYSTPITFFYFLFEEYPILKDKCTITKQFVRSDTFYLTIRMYFFQYEFGRREFDVDLERLKKFLEYAELQIQTNTLIEKDFGTAGNADSWITIADAFGMINYTTPITFFRFLFQEYPVLKKNYMIIKQSKCQHTFTVGCTGYVFEIDPEDRVL